MINTSKSKKELKSEYDKQYREHNLERIKERSRQYYLKHRKKIIAKNKKYREDNPDARKNWRETEREYSRKYYFDNQERMKARSRIYLQEHPEVRRMSEQKRRAARRQSSGTFTKEDWQAIKQQYNSTCPACGKKEPEIKLSIDHIIPLAVGGKHDKTNIQPLCKSCNCIKRTRIRSWNPNGQMRLVYKF